MPATEILAALRWWLILLLLGWVAFPLAFAILFRLPDKGYAFVKPVAILIASYVFWLLASLGFVANDYGGIFLGLILLAALSAWAGLRRRDPETGRPLFLLWLKRHWRYVLVSELVFAVALAFWVWVRSQNPAIAATEKPMEFAFLNAAGRSPTYPPLDPWLSGFSISYYYFGYVMTSFLARLAAVPEQIAFNLAIAWLFAATALGAFGLTYNLVVAGWRKARRSAVLLGIVAAFALPLAGNLEIGLEVLHANGVGSPQFWSWLDVRDLNGPPEEVGTPRYETSQWWWWRSSRVIHEYHLSGRAEEGLEPIAEYPAFSFVLGDMHPHVLALPFAFVSLAVALAWYLGRQHAWPGHRFLSGEWWSPWRSEAGALFLFTALVLGGLSFLNTWDVLIHLFVVVGAVVLARWRESGRWSRGLLINAAVLGGALAAAAIVLYLPFYLGFRSQAGPPFLLPMTMRPTRLSHFLVIFGMPILVILPTLAAAALDRSHRPGRRAWRSGLLLAVGLVVALFILMLFLGWVIALSQEGSGRVLNLAAELGIPLTERPDAGFGALAVWAAAAVARLFPTIVAARLRYGALVLFLALILAAVVAILISRLNRARQGHAPAGGEAGNQAPSEPGILPFILLLIATGGLLALGPEFVFLRDNFGQRLNTIFKFYYQAWVLWGVAAVVGLRYLWVARRGLATAVTLSYGVLLAVALMLPYFAIQSRAVEYRGPREATERRPATLNGLAYLERQEPSEYQAIMWLRSQGRDAAHIVEAVGGQYSSYGRVSASTGLPTILGWPGHEYQWRGTTPEPAAREQAVGAIYGSASWEETAELLDRYQITYVYLGSQERLTYDVRADRKFDRNLRLVYRNDGVKIYRWHPTMALE